MVSTSIKATIVDELHKPARRRYPRRRVTLKGIGDLWQADLVEMIPYARLNGGYKYLLTVIDCFTKYAWAVAVKSKSAKDVTRAMVTVFNGRQPPKNLQTDKGREFYNAEFHRLMEKHGVNHYSTQSNLKASIIERFNRTLKSYMWKQFSLQGTYRWVDGLQSLIDRYNNSVHRSTGFKPSTVTKADEFKIMRRLFPTTTDNAATIPAVVKKPRYKVGDFVRVSKTKSVFEKGYTPNWSAEIFTVTKVRSTNPTTYLLEDFEKRPVKGGFYSHELQRVRHPDVYLVEKVLRRRGNRSYVKWYGFDSRYNSWIDS
jgi:Integrase core domain